MPWLPTLIAMLLVLADRVVAAVELTIPFPAPAEVHDYAVLTRNNYIDEHVIALRRAFYEDLLWAMLNTKEFLFNH